MGQENPSLEEMSQKRILFSVPGMDKVSIQRNLVYKTADGQPMHMDIYTPPEPSRSRPAVILIHGGPSPKIGVKDMGVFVSYGELLAVSGFVAVTFNHRFLAPERLTDAAADVRDLVAYIRENAISMGIEGESLALWAFSGGGPFLAAPLQQRPAWLRAVVAYYAVLDLRQLPQPDGGIGADLLREFSSNCSLGKDARRTPPILVVRAGLDNPWINAGIDSFVQTALENGATLDLLTHPEGRHAFDILDDNARTKQIIIYTIRYLGDHLFRIRAGRRK
jgi:acetyl esterase/lipase